MAKRKAASQEWRQLQTQGINMAKVAQTDIEGNEDHIFDAAKLRKARELVANKIARGQKGFPYIEQITITPEIAAVILERNPADENRKLSSATVAKYADDMRNGRWQALNGQTIVVSADGYLNDGQHRLNAVVQSEGHIPFHVVFGAERQSRLTLDQNKVRSSGDYLEMTGIKNAKNVAATAALVMTFMSGKMSRQAVGADYASSSNRPTKAAIHSFTIKNLCEIEACFDIVGYEWKALPAPPARLAACTMIIRSICHDHDAVSEFVSAVVTGENITRTNPAYHCRNRLIDEKIQKGCPPHRTMEIVFRCWNAWRSGSRMMRLSLRNELPAIEA